MPSTNVNWPHPWQACPPLCLRDAPQALTGVLSLAPYPFSLELAALASTRGLLDLEKWATDLMTQDAAHFVTALLAFMDARVAVRGRARVGYVQVCCTRLEHARDPLAKSCVPRGWAGSLPTCPCPSMQAQLDPSWVPEQLFGLLRIPLPQRPACLPASAGQLPLFPPAPALHAWLALLPCVWHSLNAALTP